MLSLTNEQFGELKILYRALNARWLRPNEAYIYCGVSRPFFDQQIRPFLTEPKQKPIMFDKEQLDEVLRARMKIQGIKDLQKDLNADRKRR